MQKRLIVLVACLVMFLWAATAFGQTITGNISGAVKDPSGSVIPGATVTLTNLDKNIVVRTLTTDADGSYVATLLEIGRYTVSAEAPGFKKTVQTGIELHVNDKLTINMALEVGTVSQEVTVEASPVQVELQSPVAAGLISGTQVRQLSLNNRNYEQLVALMPGVTSSASDQLYIGTTNPSGQTNVVSFAINGNRNSANNWTVDGADNVDRGSNLTLLNYPSIDAIAEFKVLRGGYNPEFGRAAGGQVNVITKSGGSQFHGNAYEFFRNDVISANTFFNNANNVKRPPLRYNDFGYTIGGPVYIPNHYNTNKEKTFFFFSQEFRRVITYGTVNGTVATTAEKSGVFPHPVCVAFSGSTCTQTASQITNINPVAAAYIKDIFAGVPDPQNTVNNNLFVPLRNIFNARQELIRIDHIFGPRLSLSGRYLQDKIPTQEPGGLFTGSALPGVATTSTNSPGKSLTFRLTSTLSPSWLNEGGYAFSYGAIISNDIGSNSTSASPDIKIPLPFPVTLGRVPSVSFTGGSGVAGFGPYQDYNRNHNIWDNMTKIWGRHTTKFGFTYYHYQKTENAGGSNVGSFTFANTGKPAAATNFEQSWANFLLGNVSSFSQASLDLTPDIRTHQYEIYAQDEFRLRPNLTLSYGVRYSQFRQPIDKAGFMTNFDPSTYNPANAPKIDPVSGNILPGNFDPNNGIIIADKNSPYGSKAGNESNKNFAPRIGLVWDPFGDGKTAIRTGYGIFYDAILFGVYEQNIFANPPFVQSINISNTRFENPTAGTPVVSLAPKTVHGTPVPASTPYVQQWSLDVQRELGRGLVVDVGYFGSKGTHLLGIVDLNLLPPGAAIAAGLVPAGTQFTTANEPRLNALRPFQGYVAVSSLETWFNSNYHSLQVSLQKRFSGSSLFNLSYTWSKNLTDNQSDRSNAPQDTFNRHGGEYGLASLNRTNVLTANYVYAFPWFKNQGGAMGHLLGGWEISGITTYASGNPLTATTSSVDPAGIGFLGPSSAGPRPDMVGNPNNGAPNTIGQWFNTSAFANVPAGVIRPGNAGRGTILGPGYGRWDFSIFKNFKVREPLNIQFRTEMFNVFNHTNPLAVSTNVTASNFGQITSTRDPRIIQFGLKFSF